MYRRTIKAIRHTGIAVSNLENSLHFYGTLLGLKLIKMDEEGGSYISKLCDIPAGKSDIITAKLAADDGNLIELIQYGAFHDRLVVKSEMSWTQTCHIAFPVDNIKAEYERLSKTGVEFLSEPQISPDGYAKVVFCRDPDGIYIELVEVL